MMSRIAWSSGFSPIAGLDIESELRLQSGRDRAPFEDGGEAEFESRVSRRTTASTHPAPAAAVRLDGVSKAFGARQVLSDFALTIARGSFVAMVGRSGCGKSTLLRLIAGLDVPDRGSVLTLGAAQHEHAATYAVGSDSDGAGSDGVDSSGTRIMFQDARLLPWKTVLHNVMLGLPRRDPATGERAEQRARAVLAEVGLADRARDWPWQLSGGQRQRVALARALAHRPQLLLLDEPLGALDALTRIEMHALIERLWREHGFTAVLVTHDVHEAVALGDRIVLIDGGRIALDQPVPLERPRTAGSAEFAALEAYVLARVLTAGPAVAHEAWAADTDGTHDSGEIALERVRWAL